MLALGLLEMDKSSRSRASWPRRSRRGYAPAQLEHFDLLRVEPAPARPGCHAAAYWPFPAAPAAAASAASSASCATRPSSSSACCARAPACRSRAVTSTTPWVRLSGAECASASARGSQRVRPHQHARGQLTAALPANRQDARLRTPPRRKLASSGCRPGSMTVIRASSGVEPAHRSFCGERVLTGARPRSNSAMRRLRRAPRQAPARRPTTAAASSGTWCNETLAQHRPTGRVPALSPRGLRRQRQLHQPCRHRRANRRACPATARACNPPGRRVAHTNSVSRRCTARSCSSAAFSAGLRIGLARLLLQILLLNLQGVLQASNRASRQFALVRSGNRTTLGLEASLRCCRASSTHRAGTGGLFHPKLLLGLGASSHAPRWVVSAAWRALQIGHAVGDFEVPRLCLFWHASRHSRPAPPSARGLQQRRALRACQWPRSSSSCARRASSRLRASPRCCSSVSRRRASAADEGRSAPCPPSGFPKYALRARPRPPPRVPAACAVALDALRGGVEFLAQGACSACTVALEQPQQLLLLHVCRTERVVACRHLGLRLGVGDALAQFHADVVETGEIVARIAQTPLGFLAPLAVFGDAGRLLEEAADVLRLRLDDARDHALLDDRVGPRPGGPVPRNRSITSLRRTWNVVDVVGRPRRTIQHALDRDLGVARPLPGRASSALSNTSSTLARDTGLRVVEPLKITSCIDSPRSAEARVSPSTQRTASMMLDLPQPLGPTTPTRLPGVITVVGSTKVLNPASFSLDRRTSTRILNHPKGETAVEGSRRHGLLGRRQGAA